MASSLTGMDLGASIGINTMACRLDEMMADKWFSIDQVCASLSGIPSVILLRCFVAVSYLCASLSQGRVVLNCLLLHPRENMRNGVEGKPFWRKPGLLFVPGYDPNNEHETKSGLALNA